MNQPAQTLSRSLGLWGALFLGLGSIFGTGVFVSIGIAAGVTGPSAIAAIMLAALVATCNALSSAQLAASHPVSGGTYEYGYRLINNKVGFSAGWLFLLAKSASAATAALGTISYAAHLFGVDAGNYLPFLAGGITLIMTALVCSGLRRSNLVNTIIVSLTLFALSAFIIAALIRLGPDSTDNLTPFFQPAPDAGLSFFYASALMFVAFTGYGRIATMGEEVREPKRTIPRAIILTLVVSTVTYLGVALAAILTVGAETIAPKAYQAAAPLELAARAMAQPWLPKLIAIGAVVAMLGVLLNLILGLSRVVLAMARRRDMPVKLAQISTSGNPTWAVMGVGLFITALTAIGDIKTVWSFSAFTVLIYYSITNIAALRQPESERIFPRAISVMGLAGCLGLAFFVPVKIWLTGLTLIALGLILKHTLNPNTPSP